MGVHAAGLGRAISGLVTGGDGGPRLRKPFHVRCWEVLASRTLEDAVRAVAGSERACSATFVVAAGGAGMPEVVDIEAAPDSDYRLAPEDGLLVHANHFVHPDSGGLRQPLADDRPTTFHRYERMQTLLREATRGGRKVRVDDLKDMLRDHDARPGPICRPIDEPQPPTFRHEPMVSAILNV